MEGIQQDKKLRDFGKAIIHSPCAVIITDHQGRIDQINQRFSELTGYSAKEVRGWTFELLNPGEGEFTPETDQIWVRSLLRMAGAAKF